MLYNIIIFVLIALITLYASTQGLLSALLALVTSIFSSVLAMALTEPLQGIIAGWKPDLARGTTFLALFLIIFAITRFAADFAVPGNIKFKPLVNRVAGGVVGFFVALVVVGTLLIGFEMLPVPRVLLGYDRGIRDAAGEPAAQVNGVWFGPDRFVMALWRAASHRGLGGQLAWASVHPDLSVESYGYRNPVYKASGRTVPPDLFRASDAWSVASADARDYQALGIPLESGKRVVMVRTEVKKGDAAPHGTADANGTDNYFRIAATQVRLVTDHNSQYYPIGYLDSGTKFVPLSIASGHLVEDYVKSSVVEDWVFRIADDEAPALIEMKELGRAALTKDLVHSKVTPPLSAAAYPQHPYFKDLASLNVSIDTKGKKLVAAHAFLLKPSVKLKDVRSDLKTAYDKALFVQKAIVDTSSGWSRDTKPGVPAPNVFNSTVGQGPNILNSADDSPVQWVTVLPMLLSGQAQPDGDQNLANYPRYFDDTLEPLWRGVSEGSVILDSAQTTDAANLSVGRIVKGSHTVVLTVLTDRSFYVWCFDHDFGPSENMSLNAVCDPKVQGEQAPIWVIDLDKK